MTRGLGLALLLCLAGAVLLLAGAGATWTTLTVEGAAPLPDTTVRLTGQDLVPGLRALGVVGLAGVPALLAVRRLGRVLVGLLLSVTGAAAVVLVARVLAAPERAAARGTSSFDGALELSPVALAALLGGVLLLLAGLLAVARGRAWPALGRRYEAPSAAGSAAPAAPAAAPAPVGDKQVWEALDRGEDPTR